MPERETNGVLNRVLLGGLVVLLIAAGAGVFHLLDRPIRTVTVHGEFTNAERAQISELLKPLVDKGILTVSLSTIRQQATTLPWAQNLSLRRVWPETIEVEMYRTQPIAKWGQNKYVGPSGQLLTSAHSYADLPLLEVAIDSPESALQHYRLLAQIFAREQLQVVQLNQSNLGEWDVLLVGSEIAPLKVFIGNDSFSERAHRVLKFYRRVLKRNERQVTYLDARYPSGVAVKYAAPADRDGADDPMLARSSAPVMQGDY